MQLHGFGAGEECYKEVQWAMTDGINGHPESGLLAQRYSSFLIAQLTEVVSRTDALQHTRAVSGGGAPEQSGEVPGIPNQFCNLLWHEAFW